MVRKVPNASFASNNIIVHNDYFDHFDCFNNARVLHEYILKFVNSLLVNLSTYTREVHFKIGGGLALCMIGG